jgi:hypothetical protein
MLKGGVKCRSQFRRLTAQAKSSGPCALHCAVLWPRRRLRARVSVPGIASWLLDWQALRAWSTEFKELEIIVLRHQLAILRLTTRRLATTASTGCSSPLRVDGCDACSGDP